MEIHEDGLPIMECHACGKRDETVLNFYSHDFKGPPGAGGWGCFICDLEPDGALSIVCNECHEKNKFPRYIFAGAPFVKPYEKIDLTTFKQIPHRHNLNLHDNDFKMINVLTSNVSAN
jgi:hypothetical protein